VRPYIGASRSPGAASPTETSTVSGAAYGVGDGLSTIVCREARFDQQVVLFSSAPIPTEHAFSQSHGSPVGTVRHKGTPGIAPAAVMGVDRERRLATLEIGLVSNEGMLGAAIAVGGGAFGTNSDTTPARGRSS
jgi:hypothetical protein